MTNAQRAPRRFTGFRSPNYTQVPDELFDELMADLSGAELKVLLYIVRRTFGFKRTSDRISLSQMLNGLQTATGRVLDRGTGLSKPTLLHALRSLEAQNVIQTERRRSVARGDEPTVYQLRFAEAGVAKEINPVVKKVDQGEGRKYVRPVAKKSVPQETATRQTEHHLSNSRRDFQNHLTETAAARRQPETTEPQRAGRIAGARPFNRTLAAWRDRHAAAGNDGIETENAQPDGDDGDAAGQPARRHARRPPRAPSHARPEQDEMYVVLHAYVAELAPELNDTAPLKTSTTRAYHLYQRSGLERDAFIAQLYAARSIVNERAGRRRSANGNGDPVKRKAAYYYAVLEDLLGLRVSENDAPHGDAGSPQPE